MMKIKQTFILIFLLGFSFSLMAKDCQLSEKSYFQDQFGEEDFVTGKKEPVIVYEKYYQFKGEYPELASFIIPTSGKCKKIKSAKIKIYRKIGKGKFKDENIHAAHGNKELKESKWDKKPYLSQNMKVDIKEKSLLLKKIPITKIIESVKDDQHVWMLKIEIEFNKESQLKSYSKEIESLLIH